MGLFERWTATDDQKLPVHAFQALLCELAAGADGITLATIVNTFDLDAECAAELNAVAAAYAAKGTEIEKAMFLFRFHNTMLLAEAGIYTKQQCKTALGF